MLLEPRQMLIREAETGISAVIQITLWSAAFVLTYLFLRHINYITLSKTAMSFLAIGLFLLVNFFLSFHKEVRKPSEVLHFLFDENLAYIILFLIGALAVNYLLKGRLNETIIFITTLFILYSLNLATLGLLIERKLWDKWVERAHNSLRKAFRKLNTNLEKLEDDDGSTISEIPQEYILINEENKEA